MSVGAGLSTGHAAPRAPKHVFGAAMNHSPAAVAAISSTVNSFIGGIELLSTYRRRIG